MTHGHSNRVPGGSALDRALARASGTWGGYQAWRRLDAEKKFELVEQALGCSDLDDCFPLAL
jgi:hypothetical protein